MAVKFNGETKHGKLAFLPGVSLAFKDKGAEDYFVKAGWAKKTAEAAVHTYPAGSIEIDPETVFSGGDKHGQKVLG